MNTETIQEVKARVDCIDGEITALQCERFSLALRLSVLLAQNARSNPPMESQKQRAILSEDKFGPGVTGFERTL